MKPRVIRLGLAGLYLIIVSVFMKWNLSALFDVQIFFLLFAGISIYVLAYYDKNDTMENVLELVQKSLCPVGVFSTLLLMFYQCYETGTSKFSFTELALNLRPAFFSIVLFYILCAKDRVRLPDKQTHSNKSKKNIDKEIYFLLKHKGLTERENEISTLIRKGLSNYEIAEELFITEATVKKHITHIYEKLRVSGRKEFIEYCNAIKAQKE